MTLQDYVAPRAGAWIEAPNCEHFWETLESLPVRERGLKRQTSKHRHILASVAPRAGAWIEAFSYSSQKFFLFVAPRAGAWIEAR